MAPITGEYPENLQAELLIVLGLQRTNLDPLLFRNPSGLLHHNIGHSSKN